MHARRTMPMLWPGRLRLQVPGSTLLGMRCRRAPRASPAPPARGWTCLRSVAALCIGQRSPGALRRCLREPCAGSAGRHGALQATAGIMLRSDRSRGRRAGAAGRRGARHGGAGGGRHAGAGGGHGRRHNRRPQRVHAARQRGPPAHHRVRGARLRNQRRARPPARRVHGASLCHACSGPGRPCAVCSSGRQERSADLPTVRCQTRSPLLDKHHIDPNQARHMCTCLTARRVEPCAYCVCTPACHLTQDAARPPRAAGRNPHGRRRARPQRAARPGPARAPGDARAAAGVATGPLGDFYPLGNFYPLGCCAARSSRGGARSARRLWPARSWAPRWSAACPGRPPTPSRCA